YRAGLQPATPSADSVMHPVPEVACTPRDHAILATLFGVDIANDFARTVNKEGGSMTHPTLLSVGERRFTLVEQEKGDDMKSMLHWSKVALLLLVSAHTVGPTLGQAPEGPQEVESREPAKIYTTYNLWVEKPDEISSLNYKRGALIPAGTEVAEVRVTGSKKKPLIKFTTAKDGKACAILFIKKYHPSLTAEAFKERLFTGKPFKKLTEGLLEMETEAIRKGELVGGMSKRAVLIARGYPPGHKTPSTESNTWLYWDSRFKSKAIHFGEDGRTIRNEVPDEDEL
ncbi:MAG: hypothetical protein WBE26_01330, partial [Phycisphaerae bacterium]